MLSGRMLVKELKVKEAVAIDITNDVVDALTLMFRNRERILPVMDGENFAGTIKISDFIHILRDIDDKDPTTILISEIVDRKPAIFSPNTPIEQVIDRLCEKGVYGVPVMSGHGLIEMVRRDDILNYFLPTLRGKFKVKDVMSYNVSIHSIHEPLENLGKRIINGVDRRVVIMDYHRIEGTVTIQDLANVLLTEHIDLSSMSVKDILTPNPVTVHKCDDAMKAGQIMMEWNVWGVPVIGKDLEGMVRDKDLIQRLHSIM
jgi:CBS domain-containing protein